MGATTDYLVVGAGTTGMAFTDALVGHADVEVTLVDRRHRPGGHWNDAYPFVRLHQPSANYGVASLSLGQDQLGADGFYERATGAEILSYFGRVLDEQLISTGRVRFLGRHEHLGGGTVRSLVTGLTTDITVRRAVVDARYQASEVPASRPPAFPVADGVVCVPSARLVDLAEVPSRWVVLGSGKTAADAIVWLLEQGVDPTRVTWVRPRDAWLLHRADWQPLDLVGGILQGLSRELEAAANAASVEDLFLRLEASGHMHRLDPSVTPTMYRGGTFDSRELGLLRQVENVLRLGKVVALRTDAMALERGEVPHEAGTVYVDCTAPGISSAPARPVFEAGSITLQQVRATTPSFNAALLGHLEATRPDVGEKNRLTPPNPLPHTTEDWCRNVLVTQAATRLWGQDAELSAWIEGCRLNLVRGIPAQAGDPQVQEALTRYVAHVGPGLQRLQELVND